MSVERLDAADVERLRPLWLGLHAHHQDVAPELAPYVDDASSWAVRHDLYAATLAHGGFALVLREDGVDAGYALAGPEPSPWPATFAGVGAVAELHTLYVAPGRRGGGLGSRLLDAVDAELDARGDRDRMIGVLPQNDRAVALYARRGYVPRWLILTRFGRPAPSPGRGAVAVEAVARDELDALQPLWLALHHHHQAVGPDLGPYVDDEVSWAVIRAGLVEDLDQGGLVLRTGPAGAPTGFAAVSVSAEIVLWADTWRTGRAVAHIQLLVVEPGARGAGLGSALLDAVDVRLQARGVVDQAVGAIAPNDGAIRLYERRGFRPAWVQMTRFGAPPRG